MALEKYEDIIHQCFRCGYCKFPQDYYLWNCPSYEKFRFETYSPGGRLWLIRAAKNGEIKWTKHLAEIMYSCTTCNNCQKRCVMSFSTHIMDMLLAAKEYLVEQGLIPSVIRDFFDNVNKYGNPWGEPRKKRSEWLKGTKIRCYETGDDFLFYVGCLGSYDPRCKEVAKNLGEIFLESGFLFGVLGNEENCDGNEVKMLGEEGLFRMLAEQNIQKFKELAVKEIVVFSPHSYNAIKNYYPYFGGRFEVMHYTELLRGLIKQKKLEFSKNLNVRVTYHDPCFLGRWNDLYDAAREILNAISGVELVEMKRNRENSFCCGGGGGNFYTDLLGGENSPSRVRIREAYETGAKILAVACPGCMTMFEDALKEEGLEKEMAVKDISEIVRECMC